MAISVHRLGGALLCLSHCAAAPNKVLVAQADNTLRVINLGTRTVRLPSFDFVCFREKMQLV
jgi:hypothetical protein